MENVSNSLPNRFFSEFVSFIVEILVFNFSACFAVQLSHKKLSKFTKSNRI